MKNIEQLKKDAYSEETKKQIEADIDRALSLGINGTPSTVIGENVYIGIKPYTAFKELLIKAGAKKRGF